VEWQCIEGTEEAKGTQWKRHACCFTKAEAAKLAMEPAQARRGTSPSVAPCMSGSLAGHHSSEWGQQLALCSSMQQAAAHHSHADSSWGARDAQPGCIQQPLGVAQLGAAASRQPAGSQQEVDSRQ